MPLTRKKKEGMRSEDSGISTDTDVTLNPNGTTDYGLRMFVHNSANTHWHLANTKQQHVVIAQILYPVSCILYPVMCLDVGMSECLGWGLLDSCSHVFNSIQWFNTNSYMFLYVLSASLPDCHIPKPTNTHFYPLSFQLLKYIHIFFNLIISLSYFCFLQKSLAWSDFQGEF